MKWIELSKGFKAKVDDHLYDFLSQWKWHFDGKYARRHTPKVNGKQGNELMHRVIAQADPGVFIDHKNGDTLDNQRENLRISNHSTNAMNMRKHRGVSQYKGVCKEGEYWRVQIWKDNKRVFTALAKSERWAAMIYDLNAAALFGEYARFNFPEAILVLREESFSNALSLSPPR
jgi:hypothetical protein